MEALPTGRPDFTAVPTWFLNQASPMELAILLAIQEAPDQRISLAGIADRSGISKSSVCRILPGLIARGWLAKEATTDEGGASGPNRYALRIWDKPAEAPEHPPSPPQLQRCERSGAGHGAGHGAVPVALMAACSVKKGALFVYLALQLFEAPTISTLATVCCMDPSGVRGALRFLEEDGWIQRIDRPGTSSLFRVFFERVGARRG